MDVFVTRAVEKRGGLFRPPTLSFVLVFDVAFNEEERWAIDRHDLYDHVIIDRTWTWYAGAVADALKRANDPAFEWPAHLPREVPEEWRLTVGRLLRNPRYVVSFATADELDSFTPRARTAFAEFAQFLRRYSGPNTLTWRF